MRFKPFIRRYLILISIAISLQTGMITQVFAQTQLCLPLDTFENTTMTGLLSLSDDTPGPLNIVDDGSPGVIGSFRNIEFGPIAAPASNPFVVSSFIVESGSFSLSYAGHIAPLSILYNANGSGLNLDLSNDNSIALIIEDNDLINTSGMFTISDSANNTATFEVLNLPNLTDGDTFPATVDFPIAQFIGIGSVDLTDIHSIELEVIPTSTSPDITVRRIENCLPYVPPVPVPTLSNWVLITLGALFGLMGLIVIRRKKASIYH